MVTYNCEKCNKSFDLKGDYKRHINRINPCKINDSIDSLLSQDKESVVAQKSNTDSHIKKTILKIDSSLKKEYKCPECNILFSKNSNLHRHKKICKIKIKKENEVKEKIFKQLLEEMKEQNKKLEIIIEENKELKNKVQKIENKNINNGTINTNNNTLDQSNITNNINIQLVAYGKEDYEKLTDKEYQIIINKGFKSVQELVKNLHFNKNRPENHNIYISNIRDNNVMIYDGRKWQLRNRKETIEELYIAKKDILVDKFDELLNKLPEHAINKFERFINDEQENEIKNGIIQELKLILYNNKNIPLKTKKRLGLLK